MIFSDGIEEDLLEFNSGARVCVEVAQRQGVLVVRAVLVADALRTAAERPLVRSKVQRTSAASGKGHRK